MRGRMIWLASYPKSGNTWMRMLLSAYRSGTGQVDINTSRMIGHAAHMDFFEPWIGCRAPDLTPDEALHARRAVFRSVSDDLRKPEFFKVHDANLPLPDGKSLFPAEATHSVILIIRHPYDVAVSYAYHKGGAPDFELSVNALNTPEYELNGAVHRQFSQRLSDWSGHARSWLDWPGVPRICLRYEDMLRDTATALRSVLSIVAPNEPPDPVRVTAAVQAASFSELRRQEAERSFNERPSKAAAFFREGSVGSWRKHLAPDQCARIWKCHREMMLRLGYQEDGSVLEMPQ